VKIIEDQEQTMEDLIKKARKDPYVQRYTNMPDFKESFVFDLKPCKQSESLMQILDDNFNSWGGMISAGYRNSDLLQQDQGLWIAALAGKGNFPHARIALDSAHNYWKKKQGTVLGKLSFGLGYACLGDRRALDKIKEAEEYLKPVVDKGFAKLVFDMDDTYHADNSALLAILYATVGRKEEAKQILFSMGWHLFDNEKALYKDVSERPNMSLHTNALAAAAWFSIGHNAYELLNTIHRNFIFDCHGGSNGILTEINSQFDPKGPKLVEPLKWCTRPLVSLALAYMAQEGFLQ
jgi:hypothetical protein